MANAISALFAAILVMIAVAASAEANPKYASIIIDANTGKVLHSRHADEPRYPASLTKMMTLYMVFEAMEQGKITKNTRVPFSAHAASMQPTKLGVPAGKSISVETAIYSLVTKSATDAAAAVGELLGGTESHFAEMMTAKARALGMSRTTFRNASGLPNSRQVTTARDMATLGIALQEHFPRHFKYFDTPSFKYGRTTMRNHNRLLGRVAGVDGIKTGYTRASGFNLVTSLHKDGRSIVGVVMGGKSGSSRDAHMQDLLAANVAKGSKRSRGMLVARAGGTNFAIDETTVAEMDIDEIPLPGKPLRARDIGTPIAAAMAPAPVTAYAAEPAAPRPAETLERRRERLARRVLERRRRRPHLLDRPHPRARAPPAGAAAPPADARAVGRLLAPRARRCRHPRRRDVARRRRLARHGAWARPQPHRGGDRRRRLRGRHPRHPLRQRRHRVRLRRLGGLVVAHRARLVARRG